MLLEKKLRENLKKAFLEIKLAAELFEGATNYSQIPGLFKDIHIKLYISIISCLELIKVGSDKCERKFNSLVDVNYIELLSNRRGGMSRDIILNTCVGVFRTN